jgi:hypothetical protein
VLSLSLELSQIPTSFVTYFRDNDNILHSALFSVGVTGSGFVYISLSREEGYGGANSSESKNLRFSFLFLFPWGRTLKYFKTLFLFFLFHLDIYFFNFVAKFTQIGTKASFTVCYLCSKII